MTVRQTLPKSVPQWYIDSIARKEQRILFFEAMVGIRQDQRIVYASEIVQGSKQGTELKELQQSFDALTREIRYNQVAIEDLRQGIESDYNLAALIFPPLSFAERVRNWWIEALRLHPR